MIDNLTVYSISIIPTSQYLHRPHSLVNFFPLGKFHSTALVYILGKGRQGLGMAD